MKNFEGLLQISSWSTFAIVIYLFISITILIILWVRKKSWNTRLITSLILGGLGGLLIWGLNINVNDWSWPTDPGETSPITEITIWSSILPSIYISILLFFIPFLFFTRISNVLLNNEKNIKITKTSIFSLTMVILVSFLLVPVFSLISFNLPKQNENLSALQETFPFLREKTGFVNWIGFNGYWYWSMIVIISIFILSIFYVILTKILISKNFSFGEKMKDFSLGFKILLETIVNNISKLLPFIIVPITILMFIDREEILSNIINNLYFIVVLAIGSILIIVFNKLINKKNYKKSTSLLISSIFIPVAIATTSFVAIKGDYELWTIIILQLILLPFILINYFIYYTSSIDNIEENKFDYSIIFVLGITNLITRVLWYLLISKVVVDLLDDITEKILTIKTKHSEVINV